jgi:hypothetical protein
MYFMLVYDQDVAPLVSFPAFNTTLLHLYFHSGPCPESDTAGFPSHAEHEARIGMLALEERTSRAAIEH